MVAFRLPADSWYAEAKLSQDKPADEQAHLRVALAGEGPYANPQLAAATRGFRGG